MTNQRELARAFRDEVFDGCDHTWILGLDDLELVGSNVPWLKGACKERGIRTTGKNKRDMIDVLLEWEQRRSAQVMLWGNPRYCQIGEAHDSHAHEAYVYRDGLAVDKTYTCDGRPTPELKGYAGG